MTKPKAGAAADSKLSTAMWADWESELPYRNAARGSAERERSVTAVQTLRHRGLPWSCIARILRALREELTSYSIMDKWPTLGEDRAAIGVLADLCDQLVEVVERLSPRAQAQIATAALKVFQDPMAVDAARKPLRTFAAACRERLEAMPSQSRRESYPGVIHRIHTIVRPFGIEPSPRAGTRFHDVCLAAFTVAGLRGRTTAQGTKTASRTGIVDPTASIRAYLGEMKDQEKPGA